MRVIAGPVRLLSRFSLFHSLRFRLTLLVLLASLPALGLLLYTANQQREDALASGQEQAIRLVRLAAADQRRIFDQAEQLLTTVARLPQVKGENAEQCSQLMAELLGVNNEFENLGVVNQNGSVVCSAFERNLNILNNRTFVDEAFAANDFVIGTYGLGPLSEEPTVTYAAPVPNPNGEPLRLVFASLNLNALDTFANLANLPDGAVFSVYDRNGVLLLRSPSDESVIGKSFSGDPVVELMLVDRNGAALRNYEDDDSIYAGEWIQIRSVDSGLQGAAFITVSLPKDAVVARASEAFEKNLSRLGLAALVAVALAWIGGDLFMARDGESRKSLVAGVYRVFETGDLAQLDDVFAVDVVDRSPAHGQAAGLSGYKQLVAQFRGAFPNGTIEPYELLADNDKVLARVRLKGRHVADFFGTPPSGENVVADGIETFRFANGVIVEMWSMFGPLITVEPAKTDAAGDEPLEPKRRSWWRRLFRRWRS